MGDRDVKASDYCTSSTLSPVRAESKTADIGSGSSLDDSPELDPTTIRNAVRKIDIAVVPIMTMFYFLSFLDRANIGNARVAGLQRDLRMSDHQYQIAVTALFVPYICAELPANLLLRKIGPSILMPTLLTLWGTLVIIQGFIHTYGALVALRTTLGLVEGPMFPGIVLYLSGFYTRAELSLRIALFFSSASLSGAFSGLLSAAIEGMDGVANKSGWQWIFIFEGIFSVLIGLIGFFIVPASPRGVRSLTEQEKEIVVRRLEADRPLVPSERFSFAQVKRSVTSPQVIFVFIIFFMMGTILYGCALFLPSIVKQFGYSTVRTQLFSAGPFGAAFVVTLVSAYFSDNYKVRAIPTASVVTLTVIGLAIFLTSKEKHVLYGSLYLIVSGIYASAPILSAWMANNSEPHYRRATSIAVGFIATNAGGILSTWLFPTKEGPYFTKTTRLNLSFAVLMIVLSLLNSLYLSYQNKLKLQRRAEILAPYSSEVEADGGQRAWIELGDRHPDFRYTL